MQHLLVMLLRLMYDWEVLMMLELLVLRQQVLLLLLGLRLLLQRLSQWVSRQERLRKRAGRWQSMVVLQMMLLLQQVLLMLQQLLVVLQLLLELLLQEVLMLQGLLLMLQLLQLLPEELRLRRPLGGERRILLRLLHCLMAACSRKPRPNCSIYGKRGETEGRPLRSLNPKP